MIAKDIENKILTLRLPRIWRAENARDFSEIDALLSSQRIEKLNLDMTRVETLNIATLWLMDEIQWKCTRERITFNIVGPDRLVKMYFELLQSSLN